MHYKCIPVLAVCMLAFGAIFSPRQAGAQSVVAASAMKELPLKAWGPYNRAYLAPCCLVDQLLGQQFVFPIVISQQRQAIMPVRNVIGGGNPGQRLMPVYLQRRAMDLAPMQATDDDRAASGPFAAQNRRAHLTDANAEGLLWTYHIAFAPAGLAQKNAILKSENKNENNGKVEDNIGLKGADTEAANAWGAGEATVDCFPTFAEPEGDGLLLRVTLVNRAQTAQTYCVDLLAGMDTPSIAFPTENFVVQAPPGQNSAVIRHTKSKAVFALAATGLPFRTRCYRVSDAYFAPAGAIARRDDAGAAIPNGLLAVSDKLPDSDNADDQKEIQKEIQKEASRLKRRGGRKENAKETAADDAPQAPLPDAPVHSRDEGENQYALNRVDNIAVAPGQSVTLFFSIGVGKDVDTARISAQTLLSVAGDQLGDPKADPKRDQKGNTSQPGAYASALKAHQEARFPAGLPSIERLMAQSLANTPTIEGRRLGVSTRQLRAGSTGSLYDPNHDALMAVGWTNYRPAFAAAQLNAWFQTKTNADDISGIPIRNPRAAPPTNLFALWELYERTHDRALLKRYYPFARRRYLELLAAGRPKDDTWLFSWPPTAHDAVFIPGSLAANTRTITKEGGTDAFLKPTGDPVFAAAPDFAAYVIRASRLMQTIAQLTDQPGAEARQYSLDAIETTRALNTTLWDANQQLYIAQAVPVSQTPAGRSDTLASLLPLIAGVDAIAPAQRATLLQTLTNPNTFWSPFGLRTVSKASPRYRADEGANGAVRFGLNWLFWKALLDLGEGEKAHKLADNLLRGYNKAQTASDACPEWLDGDTGAGGGLQDYAGDACALLALWTAYHQAGVVTGGWNFTLLDNSYNKPKDSLHLVVRRLQQNGAVLLMGAMGQPGSKYQISGALSATQTTDADGILTLILPQDNTTLVIDITPAN